MMMITHIVAVKPVAHWRLWIKFADGTNGEIDVRYLKNLAWFEPLNNLECFQDVYLHPWSRLPAWMDGRSIGPCDVQKIYHTLQRRNHPTEEVHRGNRS